MKRWFLILFTDENKKEIFKVLECKTIKEVAYLLNLSPQVVSNYYHNLINERGSLKYCILYQSDV
jgi:DNA-binding NarL/FixJ family response regulator